MNRLGQKHECVQGHSRLSTAYLWSKQIWKNVWISVDTTYHLWWCKSDGICQLRDENLNVVDSILETFNKYRSTGIQHICTLESWRILYEFWRFMQGRFASVFLRKMQMHKPHFEIVLSYVGARCFKCCSCVQNCILYGDITWIWDLVSVGVCEGSCGVWTRTWSDTSLSHSIDCLSRFIESVRRSFLSYVLYVGTSTCSHAFQTSHICGLAEWHPTSSDGCIWSFLLLCTLWHAVCSRWYSTSLLIPVLKNLLLILTSHTVCCALP